jgi:hypothetical protein
MQPFQPWRNPVPVRSWWEEVNFSTVGATNWSGLLRVQRHRRLRRSGELRSEPDGRLPSRWRSPGFSRARSQAIFRSSFRRSLNLKTAKALGLVVPPELVARADEVIQ